jgi:hypothetical protein
VSCAGVVFLLSDTNSTGTGSTAQARDGSRGITSLTWICWGLGSCCGLAGDVWLGVGVGLSPVTVRVGLARFHFVLKSPVSVGKLMGADRGDEGFVAGESLKALLRVSKGDDAEDS